MRIQREDPTRVAEIASQILLASWPRPCLDFSPQYLHWHFGFPGSLPAIAVLAHDGATPIGFGGLTPRRVRFCEASQAVYLLSFVAVRPEWRGQGVATAIYSELFTAAPAGIPLVVFALRNSEGERLLRRACEEAGRYNHTLGEYCLRGYSRVEGDGHALVPPAAEASVDEFLAVAERCHDKETLWVDVNRDIVAHWLSHPWPQCLLVSRATAERPASAAVIMREQTLEGRSQRAITSLDRLFLPAQDAASLTPLLVSAARQWNTGSPEMVLLPNLPDLDASSLRRIGIRQTRTVFTGRLVSRDPQEPLFAAKRTNLRID